jgi:hypothetical protein
MVSKTMNDGFQNCLCFEKSKKILSSRSIDGVEPRDGAGPGLDELIISKNYSE